MIELPRILSAADLMKIFRLDSLVLWIHGNGRFSVFLEGSGQFPDFVSRLARGSETKRGGGKCSSLWRIFHTSE